MSKSKKNKPIEAITEACQVAPEACIVQPCEMPIVKQRVSIIQQSYTSNYDLPALYGVKEGAVIKSGYFKIEKNQIRILKPLNKGSCETAWLEAQLKNNIIKGDLDVI